ncbi:hypothetical protein P3719_18435 [Vibrio parahaemolyticus]|uniref:Uncharacterized protein n=4 Tax=Vibrio TaxID=662 RepID=A0AA92R8A7_9VIBR|nr:MULTISPECIES: hypothetical protein [Vibrio]MDW1807446.1 hypothetical protein [Vibrio sp. Vb2362]MDW2296395.1 hypothetical protein [Vibrio sp. 1404]APX09814.1 hypothetical protein BWP24_26745 [Vibrio campbellii]ARR10181.1 hypothetical protein Vc3S01_p20066 [Vibrio campbellii]EGR3454029.1 hypothetical protein [Vibrio parahaemolyticus]
MKRRSFVSREELNYAKNLLVSYGCMNKVINSAIQMVDELDIEPGLKFQAKMGSFKKELDVAISAIGKPESRAKFILNITNFLVSWYESGNKCLDKFSVARFSILLFHATELKLISARQQLDIIYGCLKVSELPKSDTHLLIQLPITQDIFTLEKVQSHQSKAHVINQDDHTLVQLDISDVPKENQSAIIGALDDLSLDEVSLSKDGKYLSLLAPLTLECGLEDTLKKVEALKACSMLDVFCQFKPISLEEIAVKYWDGKQYFDELATMYKASSQSESTRQTISSALELVNTGYILSSLDGLSTLCHRLAVDTDKDYKYKGSSALYELLDTLRGFYRDLLWKLEDMGYEFQYTSAFSNVL